MSDRDELNPPQEDKSDVEAHGGGVWSGANEEPKSPEDEPSDDVEAHGGGIWGG